MADRPEFYGDSIDTSEENDEVKKMIEWFLSVYEGPEHHTPRDDGDWCWIHGGPFDAREELEEKFQEAKEADVTRASDLLCSLNYEWTKKPTGHPDEDDASYEDDVRDEGDKH